MDHAHGDATDGGAIRVLVVEDHDELRKAIIGRLTQSNFLATGVGCAEDIGEAASLHVPDIYLIDVGLPGEDGLTLAGRIRASQPQAGIVVLTAKAELSSRLEGYEHGADVYLAKPIDPDELIAVLRALHRRLSTRSGQNASLVVDVRLGHLEGPACKAMVSEAERRTLLRFSLAPENTLERWEVMEAFGSSDDLISVRSMEVRVASLRKKLADVLGDGTNPLIGLRGKGYRLRPRIKFK